MKPMIEAKTSNPNEIAISISMCALTSKPAGAKLALCIKINSLAVNS